MVASTAITSGLRDTKGAKALSSIIQMTPLRISFLSSTSYATPSTAKFASLLVVGGGISGTTPGSASDTAYSIGGAGGSVVTQTVAISGGETLTIVVGGGGSLSSVSGSFGTVSAAAGTAQNRAGGNGTYVDGWGYYAGDGCGAIKGGAAGYWWAVGLGFPGGGRPTGGVNGFGASNAAANSGAGGSWGTSGGSGFVGILFY